MSSTTAKRPFGVTIVVFLMFLQGIFGVVVGIISAINWRNDVPLTLSLVQVIIGLVYLAVAGALGRGNRAARMLIAVITVIVLIFGLFALFNNAVWSGVIQMAISVVILLILFSRKASAFFG